MLMQALLILSSANANYEILEILEDFEILIEIFEISCNFPNLINFF